VSHLGGFVAGVILPAFLGARSVIMPGWRPDEAVELIEAEQASLAMGATVFLSDLVQRYEAGAAQKHRLTLYACAGATLPPSLVLRMSGRLKDIINRGDEKFSALDIESAIASHPDVAAVAVTAIPDERLGDPRRAARRGRRRLDRPDARHGMARPGRADRAPGGGPARPAEAPGPVDRRARAARHGQRQDPEEQAGRVGPAELASARTWQRGPERRAQLAAAAARQFCRLGFHQVSMADLATAVGLTAPRSTGTTGARKTCSPPSPVAWTWSVRL
jgi:acyl-CoA synthetase (AMP-forming)/AMP-acid ligase II